MSPRVRESESPRVGESHRVRESERVTESESRRETHRETERQSETERTYRQDHKTVAAPQRRRQGALANAQGKALVVVTGGNRGARAAKRKRGPGRGK